jgi:cytoskeletal protein CcmA (bactofilin family)
MSTGTIQTLPAGGTSGQIQLIDPPTDPNGNTVISFDTAPTDAVINTDVTFDMVASGRTFIAQNVQLIVAAPTATGTIQTLPAGGTSGQIQFVNPTTDPNGNIVIAYDTAPAGATINVSVSFDMIQSGRTFIAQNVRLIDAGPADEGTVRTGIIPNGLHLRSGDVVTLKAATVNGEVKLEGGKLIVKANSTINGKIEGEHHVELLIYDSTVVGDIHITNSLKIDLFHSNFSHNVDLENNTTVSVVSCTIQGHLRTPHNTTVINNGNVVNG